MKIRNILLTLSFLAISANAANDYLKQESYWDIQSISNPVIDPTGGMVIFSKNISTNKMTVLFQIYG